MGARPDVLPAIEGVPRALVEKWSPRRATILEAKKRILEAMEKPEKRAELIERYGIKEYWIDLNQFPTQVT